MRLWSKLFTVLPPDSNEVLASREELARAVGLQPRTVSEIMGELESIGAVYRRQEGRGVRYFVHPVARHPPDRRRARQGPGRGAQAAAGRAGMSDAAILLIDYILAKISRGPRPHATLRVWNAALAHAAADTGALEASGTQLATVAGISPQAVSRALARLVEIGALIRTGHGRYALNPRRSGSLASREQAAQKPGPHLVEPA